MDPDSIELVFVQKTSRKIGVIIEALRNGSQDEVEQQKTFMTFISGALQLIIESSNSAIVDTACPRTVAGDNWLHQFVQRMPYH